MEVFSFAQRLSLLRKERGYSQKAMAEKLHISQALLSHYEKGIREPGLDFVARAAKLYGVSTDFLLGLSSLENESLEMQVMNAVCSLMDSEQMRPALTAEMYCLLRMTAEMPELFELDEKTFQAGGVKAYADCCLAKAAISATDVGERLEALKKVFPEKFQGLKDMLREVERQTADFLK